MRESERVGVFMNILCVYVGLGACVHASWCECEFVINRRKRAQSQSNLEALMMVTLVPCATVSSSLS